MKILTAGSAGFCFGVRRAIDAVHENLGKHERLLTYGPIIHNPQVVERLELQGVCSVEKLNDLPHGSAVVIRSHGISPQEYTELSNKEAVIIDATCPYVKKIHETVSVYNNLGYDIIIVGEKEHPEVRGINGWCENRGHIVNSLEDVQALEGIGDRCCIVAQTTTIEQVWDKLVAAIQAKYPQAEAFRTICNATHQRQAEAVQIAAQVDVMLVLGGRNSSNTRKLVNLCREYCPQTFLIEQLSDLPQTQSVTTIGITAGASTPDWFIKEVITNMSETETGNIEMNFAEEMEKTFVRIRSGQIVPGTIVLVNNSEICVNIGYKSDGIIPRSEMSIAPDVNPQDMYKVGDTIESLVVKVNDGEGNVILSTKRIVANAAWDRLVQLQETGEIFEGVVREVVKGGVRADVDGVKVFIPASHLKPSGFASDLEKYVGETLSLKALEIDRSRRSVVASHKLAVQKDNAELREKVWANLEVGATVTGVVKRLADFGAFVDIGGVDGLIHIGDLAWHRVEKASDILNVGDEVTVVVLALDKTKDRISLGLKQLQSKPWDSVADKYREGDIVTGTVARIAPFGAFVQLEPGIDGLVHISQITDDKSAKIDRFLSIGQQIEVRVLEVKPEEKKISLGLNIEEAPDNE